MPISLNTPLHYDLVIPQGTRYVTGIAWSRDEIRVPLDEYEIHAEIRTRERNKLILDIASYFTIDETLDEIMLDLPPSATWKVRHGKWDLFLVHSVVPDDAVMLMYGDVSLIAATTQIR